MLWKESTAQLNGFWLIAHQDSHMDLLKQHGKSFVHYFNLSSILLQYLPQHHTSLQRAGQRQPSRNKKPLRLLLLIQCLLELKRPLQSAPCIIHFTIKGCFYTILGLIKFDVEGGMNICL